MRPNLDTLEGIDWKYTAPTAVKCQQCHQKFGTRGELLCHRPCFFISKWYKSSSSRPFRCPGKDNCKIRTRKLEDLQQHLKSTLKERPYCCNHCGKKFGQKTKLFHHIEKLHYQMYCTFKSCSEILETAVQLREHFEEVHDTKALECDQCHQIFGTERGLLQHAKQKHAPEVTPIEGQALRSSGCKQE